MKCALIFATTCLQTSAVSGELSTSTMTYTPRSEDSGKTLHCRATNPEMHQGVLEDQWKLDVQCKFCVKDANQLSLSSLPAPMQKPLVLKYA